MHRRLIVIPLLLLAACAPQASPSPAAPSSPPSVTPVVTEPPTLPPTKPGPVATTPAPVIETPLTPQPGLIVRGYVTLMDGTGVAGVSICRSYASYPGAIVAKTDASGYFESAFAFIPGDEMVTVWPMADGYSFQPDRYYWRHYYGSEDRGLDFIAATGAATPPALPACQ